MAIKLTINGRPVTVEAPEDTPLLWALRDTLGLHGAKYGCGIGQCGACTVHRNGIAIRSCITPLGSVANDRITTIEGLSPHGTHPVQAVWQEIDVPQCGYCQAGQIMAAAALLATNPKPTDAEIDSALDGNLCRCGTYLRIRQAVHKAAAAMHSNGQKPPAHPTPTGSNKASTGNNKRGGAR
ncbi:MAG TPA: (2Fe-2S)-binding protein [Chthonomonadaceae bacterium]|nr:(2Fe-2S)-binding protein [Chthonomonadaceae bacterium]